MENLQFYAEAKNVSKSALTRYLDENWRETGLLDITKRVRYLSRGQKMQCSLCRAFLGEPDILLLDEPVIALDLHAHTHFCGMIQKARNRGAATIISSHQLELIDTLCDRAGVLKDTSLCEITRHQSLPWIIMTDNNPLWKVIIESCGGVDIYYENGWVFTGDPEVIPDCIAKLASSGCRIYGVARTEGEFSSKIRTVYEIQKPENQDGT
jgi:ABC-type Na+ transport system ATPase subunit NatA